MTPFEQFSNYPKRKVYALMYLSPEQRSLRSEILDGIESAKAKATRDYLEKKCTVTAATFEERPFMMSRDIIRPLQSCPNSSGCTSCNDCGYYISHNKSLGVVYCMKLTHLKRKQKINKEINMRKSL